METKKIPIEWEGKKAEVTIKRMGYGQMMKLISSFTDTKVGANGVMETKIDMIGMRPNVLMACIIEMPWKADNNYIANELDPSLGDFLYNEIEKLNKINEMQKKKN